MDSKETRYIHAIVTWGIIIEKSLEDLFSGKDESIEILAGIISDGKLLEGARKPLPLTPERPENQTEDTASALRTSISKAFFGSAIPAIWSASGKHPFIVDSGSDCGTVDDSPLSQYLSKATMNATKCCYGGKLYYLAMPAGQSRTCPSCAKNKFSAPPGIDSLDGMAFGGITVGHIINGSVRSHQSNGTNNSGSKSDPSDRATLSDLFNQDITTPGFIRLPVCSPDLAFKVWDHPDGPYTKVQNYPCIPYQAPDLCGSSTFFDRTSNTSPSVDDCMTIVKNIDHTPGRWEVENAIETQHQLVQYGSCAFGVQGMGIDGNVDFWVGAQDIVDLITESVSRFGGSGKVNAMGEMSCKGTVKHQKVEWGIYHN